MYTDSGDMSQPAFTFASSSSAPNLGLFAAELAGDLMRELVEQCGDFAVGGDNGVDNARDCLRIARIIYGLDKENQE